MITDIRFTKDGRLKFSIKENDEWMVIILTLETGALRTFDYGKGTNL